MVETASTFEAAGSVGSIGIWVSDGGAGVADGGGVDGDVAGSN
jgi:hypothetical protein